MIYDDIDRTEFMQKAAAGLEPYSGRPTRGNAVVDGYLAEQAKSLGAAAEAISDMKRAVAIAAHAKFRAETCIENAKAALGAHFAKHGEWNAKSAEAAVSKFKQAGFRSRSAGKFAMFVRGMFFDDSDCAFQDVRCVGLSCENSGSFTFAGATFEDSASGNQFALMLPFTQDRPFGWRDSSDAKICDMPCYELTAPDEKGWSHVVSKSYDVREMRVAVAKFVAGGCAYNESRVVWTSYRTGEFFGEYR